MVDKPFKIPIRFVADNAFSAETLLSMLEDCKTEANSCEIELLADDHPLAMNRKEGELFFNISIKSSELKPSTSNSSYRSILNAIQSLQLLSCGYVTQTIKSWPGLLENLSSNNANENSLVVPGVDSESFHWDSGFEVSLGQLLSSNEMACIDKLEADWLVGATLNSRQKTLDIFHVDQRSIDAFGDVRKPLAYSQHFPCLFNNNISIGFICSSIQLEHSLAFY